MTATSSLANKNLIVYIYMSLRQHRNLRFLSTNIHNCLVLFDDFVFNCVLLQPQQLISWILTAISWLKIDILPFVVWWWLLLLLFAVSKFVAVSPLELLFICSCILCVRILMFSFWVGVTARNSSVVDCVSSRKNEEEKTIQCMLRSNVAIAEKIINATDIIMHSHVVCRTTYDRF